MADLIEKIGPIVGVVAFLGLAILAFLIFQQAREVRRLREWAGRAPERAADAAEATSAAAEARGEAVPEPEEPEEPAEREPGSLAEWWAGVRERFAPAWAELDRRSPVDPRYFVIALAAAIVAAGVLTGGFGLFGGDDAEPGRGGGGNAAKEEKEQKTEVAVLNGTQEVDVNGVVTPGIEGLADDVAKQVVKPAGFAIGEKTDAPEGLGATTIFYEAGSEDAASELANAVTPELGQPEVEPMINNVEAVAGGAPLALVVGRDDADAPLG